MAISAFGVEHGEEFSKAAPSRFNTSRGDDPKGYRQAVGNQLNPRSAKFHRKGSLGSRSKRISRESTKGWGRGALKGAAIGTGAGALGGAALGIAANKAGASGAVGRTALGGAYGGLMTGTPLGGAIGSAKGTRIGRQQNIKAGDTATYRRRGEHKSKKSKGQNFFGWEKYS